ncbi:NF-kappa-B inhibitor cactus [Condylostylus longicornis]|uniref:NF-kappa-B inhibitor cactus n=1 Tax=Condylostylus longicornis TaxID=2530218 RepID=UPI00244E2024|nr:NF-kappa-B inhibitor cactus [Condylostylus longicornis]
MNQNKKSEIKSTEKLLSNENESDSGFLSGSNHIIEVTDIRPTPKTSDKNIKCHQEEMDSGYIDALEKNIDSTLTEQFCNLNIKTSEESKNIENKSKKDKWEIYFQQDDNGDTKLHWACLMGNEEVVAALIRMVPHPCLLDIQNDDAQTALHIAAIADQPKIIRLLLISGADPAIQDHNGNTPLHLACSLGTFKCVKALTDKINESELKETEIHLKRHKNNEPLKNMLCTNNSLEIRNYDGERCIHLAAQGSFIQILRQLLECGADINAREGKSGRTILHIAIERKNEEMINFLLGEGLKCNLNLKIRTYAGITAFQFSYMLRNQTLQNDLEKLGAEPEIYESESDLSDTESSIDNSYLTVLVN